MIVIEYESKCSKKRQQAIDASVLCAANTLMSRIRKPVYINIKPIRKLTETEGVNGDCLDEGDREFTIRVDVSLPMEDMVSTILHEMVHVKQFLSGILKQPECGVAIFNKTTYDWNMKYDDRPWEIDAHSKEKQLKEIFYGLHGY
jgi:hypothetical protein